MRAGNLPGEDAYRDYLEKLVKRSVDPPQDKRDLGSLTHAVIEEHYTGRLPEVDFEYDQEDLDMAQESARVAMIHIRALGRGRTDHLFRTEDIQPEAYLRRHN